MQVSIQQFGLFYQYAVYDQNATLLFRGTKQQCIEYCTRKSYMATN